MAKEPTSSSSGARPAPHDDAAALGDLPNIGPALARRLGGIGVTTPAQLRERGPVACVVALSSPSDPACYNTLYALAGALAGVRWHDLPTERRAALKAELREAW